jgi:hypothetical protein
MRNFILALVFTIWPPIVFVAADQPHGAQSSASPQGHAAQPAPAPHALPGPVAPSQPHIAPTSPGHVESSFRPELSRESTREVHRNVDTIRRDAVGRDRMRWDGARWWNLTANNTWLVYNGAAWVDYSAEAMDFSPPAIAFEEPAPAVVEQPAPVVVQTAPVIGYPNGYQYYDSHWWYQTNGAWVIHDGTRWVAPRAFYSGRPYFYERPGVRISIGR